MTALRLSNLGSLSLLLLGTAATACAVDDSPEDPTTPEPTPTTAPSTEPTPSEDCVSTHMLCEPLGLPFVRDVLVSSDAVDPGAPLPGETTATLSNPETGKICMSGRLKRDGWAFMTLGFVRFDGVSLRDPLDATGLGIDSIVFTLENVPHTGVYVQLSSLVPDCDLGPLECQHWGFYLHDTTSNMPFRTNQTQTVRAPLADFVRGPDIDPNWQFDPHHLSTLQIGPGAFGSPTGDYAFCVSDLKFLDRLGNEVLPTASR